jgi:Flp pilus assembly protein TadG
MRSISRFPDRLRLVLGRWRRDDRGIAAVEFAMIVPLMMLMFFGMIDVSSGLGIDRKVTMIAQSLSDLPSRYMSVTDTDIANFFIIGNAMLTPYSTAPLTATISQVYIDPASGLGKVQWSKGSALRGYGSSVAVPTGLIGRDASNVVLPNQYLILSEVKYVYTPVIGYVMPKAGVTLNETTYTRPRLSTCVIYSPATACTAQTS